MIRLLKRENWFLLRPDAIWLLLCMMGINPWWLIALFGAGVFVGKIT